MTTEIRDRANRVLAVRALTGEWHCALCPTELQRTTTGDITDGVLAHYKTVHPGRAS